MISFRPHPVLLLAGVLAGFLPASARSETKPSRVSRDDTVVFTFGGPQKVTGGGQALTVTSAGATVVSSGGSTVITLGSGDRAVKPPPADGIYDAEWAGPDDPLKPGQPARFTLRVEDVPNALLNDLTDPVVRFPAELKIELSGLRRLRRSQNARVEYSYGFEASAVGVFTVPAQVVECGSIKMRLPAKTITVRELAPGEQRYALPKLKVKLPTEPVYVGQPVPLLIGWEDSPDESLLHLMRVGEDDQTRRFTLQIKYNSKREREGTVATLVPLVPGDIPLDFSVDCITQGVSGGEYRRSLHSGSPVLRVVSPPVEGRPAAYAGALGRFSLTPPVLSALTGKSGDPLTLKMALSGEGLIERVSPPVLAAEGWNVKPLPVESAWITKTGEIWIAPPPPTDEELMAHRSQVTRGPKGVVIRTSPWDRMKPPEGAVPAKLFSYAITPIYGGVQTTPAGVFAWFDPVAKSYATAAIPGITVDIEGSARPDDLPKPVEAEPDPVLLDDPAPSGRSLRLASVVGLPAFTRVQLGALAALVAVGLWRARRRFVTTDSAYLARKAARRALRSARAEAVAALARGDELAYAAAARAALRAGVTVPTRVAAPALTGAEVLAALPAESGAALRPLFDAEECARFAAAASTPATLRDTAPALLATLRTLERALRRA